MDTDQATPAFKPRRKNRRLRWLVAFTCLCFGLYGFVRLDRRWVEWLGPVGLGIHDLFNQEPGKPPSLNAAEIRFAEDVRNLGAEPGVTVLKPGFLGYIGRKEWFHVAAHERSFDDAALGRLADRYGGQIGGLYLENTGVTDEGLKHLAKFTMLRNLEIRNDRKPGPSITDAGMAHLKGLDHLWSLNLNDNSVSDAGLESIRELPELKSLYLDRTNVSGKGLAGLASLPRLNLLYLEGCKLDDEGLKSLSGAISLDFLSLRQVPLDGAALPSLKAITTKRLDITGCGFLDEEVADLKKSRPMLKIDRK